MTKNTTTLHDLTATQAEIAAKLAAILKTLPTGKKSEITVSMFNGIGNPAKPATGVATVYANAIAIHRTVRAYDLVFAGDYQVTHVATGTRIGNPVRTLQAAKTIAAAAILDRLVTDTVTAETLIGAERLKFAIKHV